MKYIKENWVQLLISFLLGAMIIGLVYSGINICHADEPKDIQYQLNDTNVDNYSMASPTPQCIVFGEDVGQICIDDKTITFTGNADKAAKLFLKYVIEDYRMANCKENK